MLFLPLSFAACATAINGYTTTSIIKSDSFEYSDAFENHG